MVDALQELSCTPMVLDMVAEHFSTFLEAQERKLYVCLRSIEFTILTWVSLVTCLIQPFIIEDKFNHPLGTPGMLLFFTHVDSEMVCPTGIFLQMKYIKYTLVHMFRMSWIVWLLASAYTAFLHTHSCAVQQSASKYDPWQAHAAGTFSARPWGRYVTELHCCSSNGFHLMICSILGKSLP